MRTSELIVVSTFRSVPEAEMAKGLLDDEGIHSLIRSDNVGGMYPAIAEAELLVRTEDANRANEVLQQLSS